MVIQEARLEELESVMQVYYNLIDSMEGDSSKPKWKKDVYPSRQFIYDAITKKELFISVIEEKIISAVIVNGIHAKEYNQIEWKINALPDEIAVIHALAVSPNYHGQGIAKKIITYIIEQCKKNNLKAIRLDVLAENETAQRLYLATGFSYIGTVQIFYEDTGLSDFLLYEHTL